MAASRCGLNEAGVEVGVVEDIHGIRVVHEHVERLADLEVDDGDAHLVGRGIPQHGHVNAVRAAMGQLAQRGDGGDDGGHVGLLAGVGGGEHDWRSLVAPQRRRGRATMRP